MLGRRSVAVAAILCVAASGCMTLTGRSTANMSFEVARANGQIRAFRARWGRGHVSRDEDRSPIAKYWNLEIDDERPLVAARTPTFTLQASAPESPERRETLG